MRTSADRPMATSGGEDTRASVRRLVAPDRRNPMYVRVTRGRFQPEQTDAVEALSSDVADAIKVLPGFVAYQGGVNREAGTIVAISSWEDRESAEFPREKLGDVF